MLRSFTGGIAMTAPEPCFNTRRSIARSFPVFHQAGRHRLPMLAMGVCRSTKLGEVVSCLKLRHDLIVKTFRSDFFSTT